MPLLPQGAVRIPAGLAPGKRLFVGRVGLALGLGRVVGRSLLAGGHAPRLAPAPVFGKIVVPGLLEETGENL